MNRLNLNELDQQLINCTQMNQKSNVSYGQLYDIARSIVSIDFGQTAAHNINTNHESNKKNDTDHEEMEKTLTKILQLCQTIIDFLLADIRRLELENKESTIGNSNNNLLQENRKLRKLLQLQQKSIIYRRINFSQEIHTLPDQQQQSSIIDQNGNNNNNNDDDNNSSLYSLDQLPSDSLKSNSTSKLQCTFCSKIFSDSQAFTKHLQLRHFSSYSNVDDPSSISLQSSITSNISFVQRILQQHCCLKQQQQQELSQSNTDITISVDKIEELFTEFDVLKNKLIKTETQLNEEKMARKIFENDLKNNFDEQIQSIKTKLENKIRKIQSQQQQQQRQRSINKPDQKETFEKDNRYSENSQSEDEKIGSKIDEMFDENEQKSSRKSNENIEKSSNNLEQTNDKKSIQSENVKNKIILNEQKTDDKKLKQNLRMELISQLTTKREQRHKQQPIPIIEPKKSEEKTKNKKDSKKEETRLKQSKNVVDSEIVDEKSSNNNNRIGEKTEQTNKEQVKSDIYNSIETRIKSYLENENDDENDGQNDHFNQAMRRIQDDRNLLIQQSRHDYDFVKIETSIRDIIDMKLKNKIEKNDDKQTSTDQTSNETSGHSNVEIVEIETQMPKQLPEKTKKQPSSTVVSSKDSPNETTTTTTNNLKSILKEPGKIAENKRNITFNNEVIEFEISPLNSDNDDDDVDGDWTLSDDDHHQTTNEQNIVKEIETTNKEQPSINNSNRMFNIVDDLNLDQNLDEEPEKPEEISSISSSTTSSTTSSEDENEQVIRKMPNQTESVNNPVQQQQMIKVDVHDKSENSISIMPIPAKRKNVSQPTINNTATIGFNNTLNSLLDDKLSNDNDRTKNDQTLRVSELAEMIEKKLQSPARSSLSQNAVNNNSTKKLFLNNTNLNTRNNILDAYDLYEF
uniref:C2H2-type domain-containing protein n=1 Tax=Dermatophagoides pteronyssinus TaxID=6956 RepID=A0A6P6XW20_DERPT|nr:putative uncharacterized protein DDB_G0282133 [Dermatophagoides pteronyssinus]